MEWHLYKPKRLDIWLGCAIWMLQAYRTASILFTCLTFSAGIYAPHLWLRTHPAIQSWIWSPSTMAPSASQKFYSPLDTFHSKIRLSKAGSINRRTSANQVHPVNNELVGRCTRFCCLLLYLGFGDDQETISVHAPFSQLEHNHTDSWQVEI